LRRQVRLRRVPQTKPKQHHTTKTKNKHHKHTQQNKNPTNHQKKNQKQTPPPPPTQPQKPPNPHKDCGILFSLSRCFSLVDPRGAWMFIFSSSFSMPDTSLSPVLSVSSLYLVIPSRTLSSIVPDLSPIISHAPEDGSPRIRILLLPSLTGGSCFPTEFAIPIVAGSHYELLSMPWIFSIGP